MSKKIRDFTDEEITVWQEHPITKAMATELRDSADAHARSLVRDASHADERLIREGAGFNRGLTTVLRMLEIA